MENTKRLKIPDTYIVRYYSHFYTGQRAKIPDCPVKYRTPGNPNAYQWRRPGAEFGGTKISERRFLWEKISIFTSKNSDDLFLVIDQLFSDSPYLYCVKCCI